MLRITHVCITVLHVLTGTMPCSSHMLCAYKQSVQLSTAQPSVRHGCNFCLPTFALMVLPCGVSYILLSEMLTDALYTHWSAAVTLSVDYCINLLCSQSAVQTAATQGCFSHPAPCWLQGRLHLSMISCLFASANLREFSLMMLRCVTAFAWQQLCR